MTRDWRRLADAVVRRRAELGRLTQADLAHRAGISLDRVQAIEGAKSSRYRRVTLMALEQALEWMPGSVESVLAGGEPTAREGPPVGQPDSPSWDEMVAEADAILTRMEQKVVDARNRAQLEHLRQMIPLIIESETDRSRQNQ